jgi:hydrogenase 3 maturation protease
MMDDSVLAGIVKGRVVIACIGNELRGDDGVGPFIAGLLRPTELVTIVDCGETPENYLGVISGRNPERVVIIDAAYFGGKPGEVRAIRKSDIGGGGASTHDAILTLFADYIEARTGAEAFFIAIQPKTSQVGSGLSPEVEAAAQALAAAINRLSGVDPSP